MTEALDLGKRVEQREQIARVIDLDAFEAEIRHIKNGYVPGSPTKIRVETALRKADEILALTDDRLLSRLREVESERNRFAEALAFVHGRYALDSSVSPHTMTGRAFAERDDAICSAIALSNSPLEGGVGSSVAGLPSSQAGSDPISGALLERARSILNDVYWKPIRDVTGDDFEALADAIEALANAVKQP